MSIRFLYEILEYLFSLSAAPRMRPKVRRPTPDSGDGAQGDRSATGDSKQQLKTHQRRTDAPSSAPHTHPGGINK